MGIPDLVQEARAGCVNLPHAEASWKSRAVPENAGAGILFCQI